ncbi:MAG TPA: hypothetical protein VE621_02430 [Bryobacteraceae bacterium]|nr:hypothetical protein [Bryobacteraceae bacterium]
MDGDAKVGVGRPRGRYRGRLDEKGRLKLPADFQEYFRAIGAIKLFVTTFGDRMARIYPDWSWDKVEASLSQPGENARALKAVLFVAQDLGGNAEMDVQGRVTFPSELREALGMDGTPLHLVMMGEHIEVFTEAEYQKKKAAAAENVEKGLELVEVLGLP